MSYKATHKQKTLSWTADDFLTVLQRLRLVSLKTQIDAGHHVQPFGTYWAWYQWQLKMQRRKIKTGYIKVKDYKRT